MAGSGIIQGIVKNDSTGHPIQGAVVKLVLNGIVYAKTTSNAEGGWGIFWQAGTYTFKATREGYLSVSKQGTIPDQGYGNHAGTLNFRLNPVA